MSVAVFLNNYLGIPAIREVVIMFFIANEGISILENYTEISGIEAPEMLKQTLKNIKDKNNTSIKDNIVNINEEKKKDESEDR